MVPNDAAVQTLLQSIMNSHKIENIDILKNYSFDQKLLSMNENSYTQSMKDADIIKKFCFYESKVSKPNSSSNSTNEDSREIGQRIDILETASKSE